MQGKIRKVVDNKFVFISSEAGRHFGHRNDFVFEGHECLRRGMELEFDSQPNPRKSHRQSGQLVARKIQVVNWEYPTSQVISVVTDFGKSMGHSKLDCGCSLFVHKANILTLDHFIDEHMKLGAQIISDVEVFTRERDGLVYLVGRNIEIIDTSVPNEPAQEVDEGEQLWKDFVSAVEKRLN